jgi:hypothetical protein
MAVPAFDSEIRNELLQRDKGHKGHNGTQCDTKDTLKSVLITKTAESTVRKEFEQAMSWDGTKRQTKADLKDIIMAVPAFQSEIRKVPFQRNNGHKAAQR